MTVSMESVRNRRTSNRLAPPSSQQFADLAVRQAGHWVTFIGPATGGDDALDYLDRPGLWKPVKSADGWRLEFDLPASAFARGQTDFEDEEDPFDQCRQWAALTLAGTTPPDWSAPPSEQIKPLVPLAGLVAQCGKTARQGRLILDAHRLALSMPILPVLDAGLPASRQPRLRELLLEAQNVWRMVRLDHQGRDIVASGKEGVVWRGGSRHSTAGTRGMAGTGLLGPGGSVARAGGVAVGPIACWG